MEKKIDKERLSNTKLSCVAIGLVKRNGVLPLDIQGSGFFVNCRGYVMTAHHVIIGCESKIQKIKKEQNIDAEIAIFHVTLQGNYLHLGVLHYLTEWMVGVQPIRGYPGPEDMDIGVIIPKEKVKSAPFMGIKTEEEMGKVSLFDEICICSYPGGEQSLDVTSNYALRLNPLMQFGRISGFLPIDDVIFPYGLQTDIIGTGGSSGSPIIDPYDCRVLGITQRVIVSNISGLGTSLSIVDGQPKRDRIFIEGNAKIGLIYGITAYHFMEIPKMITECIDQGIPYGELNFKSTKFHFLNAKSPS